MSNTTQHPCEDMFWQSLFDEIAVICGYCLILAVEIRLLNFDLFVVVRKSDYLQKSVIK